MTSNANINIDNISDIDNELKVLLAHDINLDLLSLLVDNFVNDTYDESGKTSFADLSIAVTTWLIKRTRPNCDVYDEELLSECDSYLSSVFED